MKRAAAFVLTVMCAPPTQPPEQVHALPLPVATASATPRARDYDDALADFFRGRWSIPAHAANKPCVVFQVNVSASLLVWHVLANPVLASGDDDFDDGVRAMLQKLVDDRTRLPEPSDAFAEMVRGHAVKLAFSARDLRPLTGHCGAE